MTSTDLQQLDSYSNATFGVPASQVTWTTCPICFRSWSGPAEKGGQPQRIVRCDVCTKGNR